jgi:CelD/BcsL family acetyltransferase involved in cellulose biosynthesis
MRAQAESARISPLGDVADLGESWRPLAAAGGNPFSSWEWASTWWRHFGDGREQRNLACRDQRDELIGIVPLYLHARRPLRVLRLIGHFPADQLGPVCAPERAGRVTQALRRHLQEESGWDLLLAERLPAAGGCGRELGGRLLRREPTPELTIEAADWEEFLATKSSNFRGQVRNRENRLLRKQGLRYRLADDPERLEGDMDILFGLHEAHWRSRGNAGAFQGGLKDFHRDFARLALENGWLRFWIAYLDERPAAAWYGFRIGDADWFYQGGRDPDQGHSSVGFVLMSHTIRDAIEHGISTYKLLLGAEEYKARFSNREPAVETLALARGLKGRAALAAKAARDRLTQVPTRPAARARGA